MTPTLIATILCIGLSAFAVVASMLGLWKTMQKAGSTPAAAKKTLALTIAVLASWIVLTSILAAKGVYADFSTLPPKFLLNLLLPLVLVILVMRSNGFKRLLPHVPPHWITYTQAFRIPVEIFLWLLFLDNVTPVQMTYEGLNMDVFSGILAIPAGWYVATRRKGWRNVMLAFNIVGLLLLLNILTVALLSAPLPIRVFMNEPANTFITQLPWVYLPALLVALAYTLHLFSFQWLWLTRKRA